MPLLNPSQVDWLLDFLDREIKSAWDWNRSRHDNINIWLPAKAEAKVLEYVRRKLLTLLSENDTVLVDGEPYDGG